MTEPEFLEELAAMILEAQRIHEESYSEQNNDYTKTHYQCAEEVCRNRSYSFAMANLLNLMNLIAWNDIQCWALEIIENKKRNDG